MEQRVSPCVIAIDVGGTKVAAAYVTLGSPPSMSGKRSFSTQQTGGGQGLLDAIIATVNSMLEAAPHPVVGIGVGAAGVVNPETGVITSATDLIPNWAGTPVRPTLEAEFGLPVAVAGDAIAHAVGETKFGAGADRDSVLAVAVGTGVGGAFVTQNGARTGASGIAGHVGHVRHPLARDLVCSCGREGHVEAIASGTAIADEYFRVTGTELSGREVDEAVNEDPDAAKVVEAAGRALGETLGGLTNAWDPDIIVVSGSVANSGDLWWRSLRAGFKDQAMSSVSDVPVVRGTLGSDAPLLGAAHLVAQQVQEG